MTAHDRDGVDPDEFARRVFGIAPTEAVHARALGDVAAATPRPCVGCGRPTDRVVFDVESLCPAPAWCAACEDATWHVAVELVGRDEPHR